MAYNLHEFELRCRSKNEVRFCQSFMHLDVHFHFVQSNVESKKLLLQAIQARSGLTGNRLWPLWFACYSSGLHLLNLLDSQQIDPAGSITNKALLLNTCSRFSVSRRRSDQIPNWAWMPSWKNSMFQSKDQGNVNTRGSWELWEQILRIE